MTTSNLPLTLTIRHFVKSHCVVVDDDDDDDDDDVVVV